MLTMGGSFGLLSLLLFSLVATRVLSLRAILLTVAISLGSFILLSWVINLALPGIERSTLWTLTGGSYRFNGLAAHANNLGRTTSIFLGALFLLYLYRYGRWQSLLLPVAVGVVTLGFTQSRSAIVALFATVVIFALRRRPWLLVPASIVSLACVAYFSVASNTDTVELLESLSRSGRAQEILTLTGRTNLWTYVVERVADSPWLGYGYGSTRIVISSSYMTQGGWTTGHAHNMLLQSLVTVGIIGTLFLLIGLFYQAIQFFTRPQALRDLLFAYVVIIGLTEAAVIAPVPTVVSLVWFISLCEVKDQPGLIGLAPRAHMVQESQHWRPKTGTSEERVDQ
jgi:O-antigen ligase